MNCTFDDRNDAQFAVKAWLQNHVPNDYTAGNMRILLREMVQRECEPVDDIRVESRERTVGILLGLLHYSCEQAEHVAFRTPSERLSLAVGNLRSAANLLPGSSETVVHQIQIAMELMATGDEDGLERSRRAASLASLLLVPRSVA